MSAITLRDDFRALLTEKLVDILSRAEIRNNSFLDYKIFYELADLEEMFEKKPTWKLAQEYVSDSPLMDFFHEVLSEEIQGIRQYDSKVEPSLLTSIEGYRDASSLADRLVKDFESLPRKYRLFIKLPIYGLKEILRTDRFELSGAFSLVYPSPELKSTFPPPIYEPRRRNPLLFLLPPAGQSEQRLMWEDNFVYCETSVQGFIGIYEDTSPVKRSSFLVRAFCGLGLALRLFETGVTFSIDDSYLRVYENSGEKWNAKKTRRLPTEVVQGLEKLIVHESYRSATRAVNKRPAQVLGTLKRLFSEEQKNEKLLIAAQWYFDSYCGDNELLSFVKATICLEILLGDKKTTDLIGIGELLRNRCAYLISSSQSEREQVLKDFNEIYSTRSAIVHSGKNRLTKLEKRSFYKLRQLCARVIRKEILLGSADSA